MKAILELDLPESCIDCRFGTYYDIVDEILCEVIIKRFYVGGICVPSRAPFCPLRIAPEKEAPHA